MQKDERLRVYVWEFPVRFTHWINFLCIIALSVTGYYIGDPFMHSYSSDRYIMGWMRFIHFVAAYTFMLSVIIRIYWAFMGNRFAHFMVFYPFMKGQIGRIIEGIKFYLFISRKPSYTIGHTALAGFTYIFIFNVFIFQIISGFAMYSLNHSGAIWTILGGWLLSIMHVQTIRLFHHLFMYIILTFAAVHVYVSWYLDIWEKSGLIDSIFSGYKYALKKKVEEKAP